MYHLRLKGKYYEIGVKRGNIFNKCNIVFPIKLDEYQLRHGRESEKILRHYHKEVVEEIKGVTDTIKVDYMTFVSWMLCMGCCMYNLDDNIPLELRGCTAFAIKHNDEVYYGRNNDLPPFLERGSKSEVYRIDNALAFNITTSSFINGEEGINECGVVIAMTFVLTDLKKIKPGFNSCFIVRYLLEKAHSTEEAIKLLEDLPVASNCNILIADKSGSMVVMECTPDMKNKREPLVNKNGDIFICTVNSFTSNKMQSYDDMVDDIYSSRLRYSVVEKALNEYDGNDLLTFFEDILAGKFGFMCQYERELNFDTVWSSVINLKTKEIHRAEGNPKKKAFISDKRLCEKQS